MPMLSLALLVLIGGFAQAAETAQVECQSQLVRTNLEIYEIQPKGPDADVIEFTTSSPQVSVGMLELSFSGGEFTALIEVQKISKRSNWFKDQSLLKVTTSLFDGKTKKLLAVSENHSNWIQSESMIRNKEAYGPRVISMVHIPQSLQAIYSSGDPIVAEIRNSQGMDVAMTYALAKGLVSGQEPYRIDTVCTSTAPL